jgi:trehalose-phosphatase
MSSREVDRGLSELVLDALQRLASNPVLLIACDYDGTLAPIVDDPGAAKPCRESVAALRALASMPDTHVAVVSGRSLRDLATLSRLPDEIHLIGSHGSEFDVGFALGIPEAARRLHIEIDDALEILIREFPGASLEHKPASTTMHVRGVAADRVDSAIRAAIEGPGMFPGAHVKLGKMVVEIAVVETNKGAAIDAVRQQVSADAAIFVGDDVTDEDAFAVMRGPDMSVKVGEGESVANHRVGNPDDVARLLAVLVQFRKLWVEGSGAELIEHHSMLSNLQTVAMVQPDARLTWMCHPRADSPSLFAQLLGGPSAGFFSIQPTDGRNPLGQRYVGDTMVLETSWPGATVTDFLNLFGDHPSAQQAVESPGQSILVRIIDGRGAMRIEFAPRLDFGRAPTCMVVTDLGVEVVGSAERLHLHATGLDWSIVEDGVHQTAVAEITLTGEPVALIMSLGSERERSPFSVHDDAWVAYSKTVQHWNAWSRQLELPEVAPTHVLRSALILKSLCHAPSGAIIAAGTTSLPEVIGGIRNWDYRMCWPRDAAMVAATLVSLGSTGEAEAFLDWLTARVHQLGGPEQLRPVYPIVGDDYVPEAVIAALSGYRGSRPVRIGNAAEHQVQMDVFGPVVDLIDRLVSAGGELTDERWWLVEQMAEGVARRWHEPDHGIWEERRPVRHHVHSKVMCWQTLDRAIRVGNVTGRVVPAEWSVLRGHIEMDVLAKGWDVELGVYTIAYGDPELDAAVLQLALSGLMKPDDPRFIATVARIDQSLRRGPVVYRYLLDDGLPGVEGGFHLCTSWLIQAYLMMGRRTEAELLFERLLELAGPTGLLSEQYDPHGRTALGNHPQAYSHLGLIDAALALSNGKGVRFRS